jgi:hypothetical protein
MRETVRRSREGRRREARRRYGGERADASGIARRILRGRRIDVNDSRTARTTLGTGILQITETPRQLEVLGCIVHSSKFILQDICIQSNSQSINMKSEVPVQIIGRLL